MEKNIKDILKSHYDTAVFLTFGGAGGLADAVFDFALNVTPYTVAVVCLLV